MATPIIVTASTVGLITQVSSVLRTFQERLYGNLKRQCSHLREQVAILEKLHAEYSPEEIQKETAFGEAFSRENDILKSITEGLHGVPPKRWMLMKRWKLRNFLTTKTAELKESAENIRYLLEHKQTNALMKMASGKVPDSTDMECANADQSGVTMDNEFSGNIQDSTNQTDNVNVTIDSDVSYDMIDRLAKKIGRYWRDVGRKLCLDEEDLQNIHADHHQSQREKAHGVLNQWRTSNDRPTYRVLADALMKAERTDLKKFVEANFQKYH